MNAQSHLTNRQIEQYVTETGGLGHAKKNDPIETHIADCDSCRERILEAERSQFQLRVLQPRSTGTRTAACPSDEALEHYAAGLSSPEAPQIMDHATECDFCSTLLRQYAEDFSGHLPAEAREMLDRLPTSNPEWQRKFVREHAIERPTASPKPLPFRRAATRAWLIWGSGLAAAALILAIFAPGVANRFELRRAQQLAQAAIADQYGRPDEMRLAWAPYSKFELKRGNASAQVPITERKELAEAAMVASNKQSSTDPEWMRLRGRVELLQFNNKAVDLLIRAKDSGLADPETEIDLAVAYYQQALSTGRTPPDLDHPIDLLQQVLQNSKITQQQKATALFDLAIAYEKTLKWSDAVAMWEQYLQADPNATSPWRREAEEHLRNAQAQIPPKQSGWRSPSFFLSPGAGLEVQNRIEDYQDVALREWLPLGMERVDANASEAVHRLAALLQERHGDPWMKDFLKALQPGDQEEGLRSLAEAIGYNKRGLHTRAKDAADVATGIFKQHGNSPGKLRSRFEFVYANQRLLEEQPCLEDAKVLGKELENTEYRWLRIQIALEQAACLHFEGAGKSEESERQIESARDLAEKSSFHILNLRVLAFAAGMNDSGLKESSTCWDRIAEPLGKGLAEYWEGPDSPGRLYEFYSLEKKCAGQRRLWRAAEALQRRMIVLLERDTDPEDQNVTLDATAHSTLAQILREQGNEEDAEAEARRAASLAGELQDEDAIRIYELPIQLELADLQLERGEIESAQTTVNKTSKLLKQKKPSDLICLKFYRVQGDVQRKLGQLAEAEQDYQTGLEKAEVALRRYRNNKDKRWQWASETGDLYRGLVGTWMEQKNDREALQLWEWYQYRSFAQDAGLAKAGTTWADIERAILEEPVPGPDPSATRLVYAAARDRIYIWIVRSDGTIKAVSRQANRWSMEGQIREYAQKCSENASNTAAFESDGKVLFSLLLEPVIADLREDQTIAVDLDQVINGVPLEALQSPEGWYFGQKYAVAHSPGFVREAGLRPPIQPSPGKGLLLDSGDLPDSEHDDIVASLPGIKTITGSEQTPEALRVLLPDRETFIFIGHGKLGALMVGNSMLTAQNFPPDSFQHLGLAVLAACSTGVEYNLQDTSRLMEVFLGGGTSNVIASQWDVNSEATKELMQVFFDRWRQGHTAARSLFEARQQVFQSHSHPYYWAAFTLTGRIS